MRSRSDMRHLFVLVMPVTSEHKDKDIFFKNTIDEAVFLCDLAAPSAFGLAF